MQITVGITPISDRAAVGGYARPRKQIVTPQLGRLRRPQIFRAFLQSPGERQNEDDQQH